MNSGQVLAYLIAIGLLVLAFVLAKKKTPLPAAIVGFSSFLTVLVSQLLNRSDFFFKGGFTVEQSLCWIFGTAFFGLACFFVKHKNLTYAFVTFLVSVFTCFCGLSGVQSILKTHMLNKVAESLKSYGEKIDKFQIAVADMNHDLQNQQATNVLQRRITDEAMYELRVQGTNMSRELYKMFELANAIYKAQTNIDEQQKKLEDVEYWVRNLFNNMTNETFTLKDTNRTFVIPHTNGATPVVVSLAHVPLTNSIKVTINPGEGLNIPQDLLQLSSMYDNIVYVGELFGANTNTVSLRIEYVMDKRRTNIHSGIPLRNSYQMLYPGFRYNKP